MNKFTDIRQFKNVLKTLQVRNTYVGKDENGKAIYDENQKKPLPIIDYIGTVKLHGSNCGVRITKDRQLIPQSRTQELSVNNDYCGFAKFIEENKDVFLDFAEFIGTREEVTVFGEWVGPGIHKDNVGIAKIEKKIFMVFFVKMNEFYSREHFFQGFNARGIYSINQFPHWSMTVDFNSPNLSEAEELTVMIDKECPAAKMFGITGSGEGIVWTPKDETLLQDTDLWFKTKGKSHSETEQKVIIPMSEEKVKSIKEFISKTLTEQRLSHGLRHLEEIGKKADMSSLGEFIRWCVTDVLKEESDLMNENKLSESDVKKQLTETAKNWYQKRR